MALQAQKTHPHASGFFPIRNAFPIPYSGSLFCGTRLLNIHTFEVSHNLRYLPSSKLHPKVNMNNDLFTQAAKITFNLFWIENYLFTLAPKITFSLKIS